MDSTSFGWKEEWSDQIAVPYNDTDESPHPQYLFSATAAAGMYTSVADLAKFVAANTVHAKRGLASASTRCGHRTAGKSPLCRLVVTSWEVSDRFPDTSIS